MRVEMRRLTVLPGSAYVTLRLKVSSVSDPRSFGDLRGRGIEIWMVMMLWRLLV